MDPLISKLLDFGATGVMLAIAVLALWKSSQWIFGYMRDRISVYENTFLARMAEHEAQARERHQALMDDLKEHGRVLGELVEKARKMNGKGP